MLLVLFCLAKKVTKKGEPVAPAWLWLDARAADIVEEFTTSQNYFLLLAVDMKT